MSYSDISKNQNSNHTLAQRVENALIDYLKLNKLGIGDLLPKETEIAKQLNVSRNIVREALSRLKMMGIVESKKRQGMRMAEPDVLGGMDLIMDPALLGTNNMKDLFELRLVLEVGMADLIFERMTEFDVLELAEIAHTEYEDEKCKISLKSRLKHEIKFHGKLYQMTGNSTMTRFQKMLLPIFNYMMQVEHEMHIHPEPGKISHLDLVKTLKHGNPAQFRTQMREHLTPHYARL